jgi:two-component system response regulator YesN
VHKLTTFKVAPMAINIEAVKSTIFQNVHLIQENEDVAYLLKVNPETLRKVFKRKMKIPLSEYITIVRIQLMKELLLTTNLLCFEICFRVGFTREDSGAKSFKRITGVSMKEYQKKHSQT